MDIARMHLSDSLTLFVKTKSTHMQKEGWYNVKVPMEKKKKSISWDEWEKLEQGNEEDLVHLRWGRLSEDNTFSIIIYFYIYVHRIWEREVLNASSVLSGARSWQE